jgi:hypothetical protein
MRRGGGVKTTSGKTRYNRSECKNASKRRRRRRDE